MVCDGSKNNTASWSHGKVDETVTGIIQGLTELTFSFS